MISSNNKKIFSVLFNLGVPALIIIYSLLFYNESFLCPFTIALSTIIIAIFLAALFLKSGLGKTLKSIVIIFNITYLLLEFSTYWLLSFGIIRPDIRFFFRGLEATDRKVVVYDSICGYKGVPGNRRYVSINNGKLEMDNITKVNNEGWFSDREYFYKKKDAKTKRYMVLGDSYSSGLVVPVTWVDLAQKTLIENGNDSVELYNFSFDGSGIANWYRIFFYEILPKYEFDGIIIAASFEKNAIPDFDRKFIMAHSFEDANYIQGIDISKQHPPAHFSKENAVASSKIYTNSDIDKFKDRYVNSKREPLIFKAQDPSLCFLNILYGVSDGFYKMISFSRNFMMYNKPYDRYEGLVDSIYKMEYFDERYKYSYMLKEIINSCQDQKKEVTLITIPDCDHALDYINGIEFVHFKEQKFLAEFYHLKYYNGFEIFAGKDNSFIRQCFYEYDMHWNENGVKLFTKKLVESNTL